MITRFSFISLRFLIFRHQFVYSIPKITNICFPLITQLDNFKSINFVEFDWGPDRRDFERNLLNLRARYQPNIAILGRAHHLMTSDGTLFENIIWRPQAYYRIPKNQP